MTEGKRELLHLIELDRRIDAETEEVQRLRLRLQSIQASGQTERISGTKETGLADGVAQLVDLQRKLSADIDCWIAERQRIIRRIRGIEPEELSDLLYYRYVLGMKLYKVAARMKYSYIWARIRHGEALAAYSERYFSGK